MSLHEGATLQNKENMILLSQISTRRKRVLTNMN